LKHENKIFKKDKTMKRIALLSLISASMLVQFSACKKSNPTGDTTGGSTDTLRVSLSSSRVEYNGFDYVAITVTDKAGTDVTTSCSILLNGSTAISPKYVPTAMGNFAITAKRGGQPSESKTLSVVTKTASPFTQKALVEDLTGAWCGFCTRVYDKLDRYKANNPNLISLGVHAGSGTDPFKFQYYTNYLTPFQIGGYPAAVLNRKAEWSESTSELDGALQNWAPLGLAISSTLNGSNVSGTVKVKFNVNTIKTMKIVIGLTENGLVYPQVNYYSPQYGYTPYLYGGVSPVANFEHNYVLRKTFTNLFGDAIPQAQLTKDNVYEIPFNMTLSGSVYGGGAYTAIGANCGIVAFVVDGSAQNGGLYNVQYAAVGATKNFD
jgi:hypothetical protein